MSTNRDCWRRIFGYSANGRFTIATKPQSTIIIEITDEKTGLLIKNVALILSPLHNHCKNVGVNKVPIKTEPRIPPIIPKPTEC